MTKPKVLVVEDERITAEEIQSTVRNFGYAVSSIVSSSREAIKEAEENKPDLVLMDIKLKGDINGVEAAEQIRARFDIPIIYITALADDVTLQGAKITEPFGYIHKPIEEKELHSAVEIALYRHRMERKLKEGEERYRTLFEESIDAIYITSRNGKIIDVNQAFLDLFGYAREEIIGRRAQERYVHSVDRKRFQEEIEQKRFVRDFGVKLHKKDRTEMDCLISSTVRFASDGSILGYQGIIRDITEQKRAEEALRESEARYKFLVDNSKEIVLILSKRGKILFFNKSALTNFGYSEEEIIGKSITHFLSKDCIKETSYTLVQEFLSRSQPEMEVRAKTKSGGIRYLRVAKDSTPIYDKGKLIGVMINGSDVTEHKQAEEEKEKLQAQLIQSEKMAGVGTLASGIAHEFNNLLQIMRGHVEFTQKTKKAEDIEEALDVVINNTDRAARIIRDLLIFSGQEGSEKKVSDITEPIESVLSLIESQLEKQNIRVVRKYEEIPEIAVNKVEMDHVFLDMIINARDAMLPEGGRLEISVKQVDENVEVNFVDTGKGIEEENLKRVFEPFYTTKGAIGKNDIPGTGLGLYVSFGIVKAHGGTIEVESDVGRGSTFTVKLPVKEGARRIVEKQKEKRIGKRQSKNILVVDDEEEICRIFTKCLFAEGHRVKSVSTGRKAIDLVEKEYFNVVFLDIVMPGIPCIKILGEIKGISPKTKVVMITGRLIDSNLLKELKKKGASAFLQKPFKMGDIKKMINSNALNRMRGTK